jgi:hypothetical protein
MQENGQVLFGRVSMKPGKPLTFGIVSNGKWSHDKLMFATPGNPVSSLITSLLFVIPGLRATMGEPDPHYPRVQVRLTNPVVLDPERPEYHRATVWWDQTENVLLAQSTGSQASSRLLSMRSANALLELPQKSGSLSAGDFVSALLIGSLPAPQYVPPVFQTKTHSHGHSHAHSHGHGHSHGSRKHANQQNSHGHSHGEDSSAHSHGHSHAHSHGNHSHQQGHLPGHSHGEPTK